MKRSIVSFIVTLSMTPLVAFAQDGPAVKLPKEIQAKQGRIVRVKAETQGKTVRWFLADTDLADLLPIREDGKEAAFSSPYPGRYRIFAYTAMGDFPSEPAACVVVVSSTPGPAPPGPDPTPPPTPPNDPFAVKLDSIFRANTDPKKHENVKLLAGLYRNAAGQTVSDPNVKTIGDLYSTLVRARKVLMPDESLLDLRQAIQVELDSKLPSTTDAILDSGLRQVLQAQFKRVADILEVLK